MTGSLLPLPDDPRVRELLSDWPRFVAEYHFPKSAWLGHFEAVLREHYPDANSDSLTLTARTAAPFPLALPGVP